MNKEENKILPQLRFPEFINDKEWKIEPFNDVYSFKITNSFSRDKLNYEKGTVKNIHYGDIHTKFSTHFDILKEDVPFINPETSIDKIDADNYCKEGDLVIADASEDIEDIGKSIEIINLNKEKLLAGLHTFLARPIYSKITIGFGGHLFKSNGIVAQIKKEAQGAKVLGVSKGRLSNLNVYFPVNPKEQQKIANCLSSLDDVINTETEKLDLLQDHKKGLLQQLFPQQDNVTLSGVEGQPKYRFPEFVGDGDWDEMTLDDLGDIVTGKTPSTKEKSLWDGKILFITPTDISENKYQLSTKRTVTKNDKLKLLPIGSIVYTCIASIGKIALTKKISITNQQINSIIPYDKQNGEFIYYLLVNLTGFIKSIPATSTLPIINKTEFSKIFCKVPKNPREQQKIANCLSSVDELIESQQQKIEGLKAHKKGLLQKLFPTIKN